MSIVDVSVLSASEPPAPVADMPRDWSPAPLGSQAEVRARISEALPGTTWWPAREDGTHGLYAGECACFEFTIAKGEPVKHIWINVRRGKKDCNSNPGDVLIEFMKQLGWYGVESAGGDWLHYQEWVQHWLKYRHKDV